MTVSDGISYRMSGPTCLQVCILDMFLASGLMVKLDDIPKTIDYTVDPNCDQGIWINYSNLRLKLMFLPERIYRWLSAVIPSTNYHGALNVRLEDTGLWFIDGARFARWKATADDFLWICGIRMCSHHLQIILGSKLVWQLALARLF